MVMVRMGSIPIPSIKQSVSIDTMINFDGDGDGDGHGTCKRTLSRIGWSLSQRKNKKEVCMNNNIRSARF